MSEATNNQHAGESWEEQTRTSHSDDAWHSHAGEEPPQHEHGSIANPIGIMLITVASIVFVVVIVIVVMVYFNQRVRAMRVEREEKADFTSFVSDQNAHANQMMGEYGWVDAENAVIRIPIDRAIELTAEDYANQR